MPPFRAIVVFYHVALLDSIARAADRLGVTPSAVSQQVRMLEEQVGTSLVTRSGRNVRLTEAGERYFEEISEHVESIIRSTETMRGIRRPTTITIRATPTIATKWLLPRLGDFLSKEPGTEVHLDGSNEPVDFTRDAVDLEIRHGTGGWPGLHVEPLTSERFLPVCSPSLAGPGALAFEDFVRFRLIQSVKAQIQWGAGFEAVGIDAPRIGARLSFDRSHMAIEAAALGLGIALESELMMESELRSGRLVVPVARTPELRMSTQWLVCPRSNLRKRRVVRLLEWLREQAIEWQSNSPANSLDFLPK